MSDSYVTLDLSKERKIIAQDGTIRTLDPTLIIAHELFHAQTGLGDPPSSDLNETLNDPSHDLTGPAVGYEQQITRELGGNFVRPTYEAAFDPARDYRIQSLDWSRDYVPTADEVGIVRVGDRNSDLAASGPDDIISVAGRAANSLVFGFTGDDSIQGGDGNDYLYGGVGDDSLGGGDGDDMLWGDEGDDILVGGGGYDSLMGGSGNDRILVHDYGVAHGNGGDDVIVVRGQGSVVYGDTPAPGQGGMLEGLDIGTAASLGDDGNDTVFVGEGWHTIDLGGGDDTLVIDPGAGELGVEMHVRLGAGADTVHIDADGSMQRSFSTLDGMPFENPAISSFSTIPIPTIASTGTAIASRVVR